MATRRPPDPSGPVKAARKSSAPAEAAPSPKKARAKVPAEPVDKPRVRAPRRAPVAPHFEPPAPVPVPKTRKRPAKKVVDIVPLVMEPEPEPEPIEIPTAPVRNVAHRRPDQIRLDGGGEWTKRFVKALKAAGKGVKDLLNVDPADVDELTDDDIFRVLVLEIYGVKRKRDDYPDIRPLQDALFNFDVRAVADHRDEVATHLMNVVGDRKKVQAMLQNVLRFVSIQERFGSFRTYLIEKVDRFENLEFDLEHRFVGLKPVQIQNGIEALGLTRRLASQEPTLRVLGRWGAIADARKTPDNWADARTVLRGVQREVGCPMGALESMFILFESQEPVKS